MNKKNKYSVLNKHAWTKWMTLQSYNEWDIFETSCSNATPFFLLATSAQLSVVGGVGGRWRWPSWWTSRAERNFDDALRRYFQTNWLVL
jgi:hypothetical protein